MRFIIGAPIANSHTPESYEVEVKVMFGDGDGYDTFIVGPFLKDKDEELLQHLIETLERMEQAYPHGRGGGDEYNHVEGFAAWFEEDYDEEEATEDGDTLAETINAFYARNKNYPNWPHDVTYMETSASYNDSWVVYYDESKTAHKVTVEK